MKSKAAVLFVIIPGVYNDYTPIAPIHLTGLPIEKVQESAERLIAEDLVVTFPDMHLTKDTIKFIWLENDMGVIMIAGESYGFNVKYHAI